MASFVVMCFSSISLNKVFLGQQNCVAAMASINFDSVADNVGLEGCSVSVSCNATEVDTVDYYTFESAATCGAGYEQAQRSIEVRARSE